MDIERRDNDKLVEDLRKEADDIEAKVNFRSHVSSIAPTQHTAQIAEHLKKSEAELNELLAEYWKLRHETGRLSLPSRSL